MTHKEHPDTSRHHPTAPSRTVVHHSILFEQRLLEERTRRLLPEHRESFIRGYEAASKGVQANETDQFYQRGVKYYTKYHEIVLKGKTKQ